MLDFTDHLFQIEKCLTKAFILLAKWSFEACFNVKKVEETGRRSVQIITFNVQLNVFKDHLSRWNNL